MIVYESEMRMIGKASEVAAWLRARADTLERLGGDGTVTVTVGSTSTEMPAQAKGGLE